MRRPVGLQKQRRRGSRLPVGAIVVDRSSRRGNPFTVEQILRDGEAADEPEARVLAVRRYADWLDGHGPRRMPVSKSRTVDREWINAHMGELVGHDLACTCPVDGLPCHRDVLLARAALLERTEASDPVSVRDQRAAAVASVRHSTELEGGRSTDAARALQDQWVAGDSDLDELGRRTRALYEPATPTTE